MTDTIFKYPLDLLGTSATNKVIDEAHTVGLTRARIFPSNYGPFYGSSVTVVDAMTGKELTPNDQYVLVHFYSGHSIQTCGLTTTLFTTCTVITSSPPGGHGKHHRRT